MNPVTQAITIEFEKCGNDAVYFLKNYFYIQHPITGKILFNLYPFQEKLVEAILTNDYIIINKSRQMGISTLMLGIALWKSLFSVQRILIATTKQAVSINQLNKLHYAYENLPYWFKHSYQLRDKSKNYLDFSNGSRIMVRPVHRNAVVSETLDAVYVDECAWISDMEEFYCATRPTLTQTNGQFVVMSSPNKVGNWFANTFFHAQHAMNVFKPIELPWHVHPDRDEKWMERMKQYDTEDEISENYNCVFLPNKK